MNRRALFAVVVVALPLGTVASLKIPTSCSIQSTSKPPAPAPAVVIPFELVNRHIVLKVQVNNSRPLSFVLDTGDQFAIINLDRAQELGLKLEGQVRMGGAGAQLSVGAFVRESSFTIPGFAGFSQPVTLALPIGNLASRFGQDFDGIIGSEFIKQFIVEIDYQTRVIKLHNKSSFAYSGPGESIPIQLDQYGHPIMEAEVTPLGGDPVKGKFVLDLGSGLALALYSPFVAEHRLLGPNLKTIKALGAGGAGGAVSGQIGRVSELKFGNFRISSPITFFSEDKEGAFASAHVLGNIGARIMSRFRILLDYDHSRIILEPTTTLSQPFDNAISGLTVQAEGKDYRTFRITDVLEKSPASEAALQPNDIITAIDGKPAADVSLTKLNDMFEQPVAYKLTVKRGGQTLQVTLKPRKLV